MNMRKIGRYSLAALAAAVASSLSAVTLYDYATEADPVSKTYYVSVPTSGTVDALIVTYAAGGGSAWGTTMVVIPGTGLALQVSASGGSIGHRHVTGLPESISGEYVVMHIGGATGFGSSTSFTTTVSW